MLGVKLKYKDIIKGDGTFIWNKVYNEWSNLSQDEILSKVKKLADSLL